MIPVLAFVQHYKKFYTSQFEAAAAAVAADLTPTEWQAMQDYIARMDATLRRRLAEKGENA